MAHQVSNTVSEEDKLFEMVLTEKTAWQEDMDKVRAEIAKEYEHQIQVLRDAKNMAEAEKVNANTSLGGLFESYTKQNMETEMLRSEVARLTAMMTQQTENAEFVVPKAQKRKGPTGAIPKASTLTLSNQYESLSVDEEMGVDDSIESDAAASVASSSKKRKNNKGTASAPEINRRKKLTKSQPKAQPKGAASIAAQDHAKNYVSSGSSSDSEVEEMDEGVNPKSKKRHSPPILVEGLNIPKFRQFTNGKEIASETVIKPSGKTVVKCKYEDRNAVLEWLGKNCSGGNTMTCNDDRQGVSLVKGIHLSYKPEFVKSEIERLVEFKIVDARHFQTNPKSHERQLHWWKIVTETKAHALELAKKVKVFDYSVVHWEPLKQRGVLQCYRCQGYNHIARNCLNKPRCVKCEFSHGRDECSAPPFKKGTGNKDAYYCVNCNKSGHPANAMECPIRAKWQKKVDDKNDDKNNEKNEKSKNFQNGDAQSRPIRHAPTKDDFDVPVKKRRGAPEPVEQPNPPKRSSGRNWINFREENDDNLDSLWTEICDDTSELFNGKSPSDMIKLCKEYHRRCAANPNNREKALLNLYMAISK